MSDAEMSNTAMEIVSDGICPLCKQRTDSEIVPIEVSCWGYYERKHGCLDCKDRVSLAVRCALVSVGFSQPVIVSKSEEVQP